MAWREPPPGRPRQLLLVLKNQTSEYLFDTWELGNINEGILLSSRRNLSAYLHFVVHSEFSKNSVVVRCNTPRAPVVCNSSVREGREH